MNFGVRRNYAHFNVAIIAITVTKQLIKYWIMFLCGKSRKISVQNWVTGQTCVWEKFKQNTTENVLFLCVDQNKSICKETLKNIKSLKGKHCLICFRGWRTRPSRTVYCHQGVRLKVRTQRQTQCICIHRYCFTNRFNTRLLQGLFIVWRCTRVIYPSMSPSSPLSLSLWTTGAISSVAGSLVNSADFI